ncbi:MAG: lipopolysaccharide kinase InaA family protein [Candidatus Hydrogenedentota bacterium]
MISPLDGFEVIERDNATALIREEYVDALTPALFDRTGLEPGPDAGRGTVQFCDIPGGKAVVREYRRGGFVRHFVKRHYFNDNRALKELKVWNLAYENDLSVPKPLATFWKKQGPFYSGSFVAEHVESMHLEDWLNAYPDNEERELILKKVGKAFADMHALQIMHADLQVRNVLIAAGGDVKLIDFDNARIQNPLPNRITQQNLLRFERSLFKRGFCVDLMFSIFEGYGVDPNTMTRMNYTP